MDFSRSAQELHNQVTARAAPRRSQKRRLRAGRSAWRGGDRTRRPAPRRCFRVGRRAPGVMRRWRWGAVMLFAAGASCRHAPD